MKLKNVGSGVKLRGFRDKEDSFVVAIPRDSSSALFTSDITIDDRQVTIYDVGPVAHEFDLLPQICLSLPQNFQLQNLTPTIISLNGLSATRLADGNAQVALYCTSGKRIVNYPVSETDAQTIENVTWLSGSTAKAATDSIDSLIAGLTPGDATQALWSTRNDSTATYAWNTNLWAAGIDLTCASVWNSGEANKAGGALITPRHFICANHYHALEPPNSVLRFVAADNTTVTRFVSYGQRVDETDIYVGMLDSDVPSNVGFASLLPSNWPDYLPGLAPSPQMGNKALRIPVAGLHQTKLLTVFDLYSDVLDTVFAPDIVQNTAYLETPIDPQRSAFYSPVVTGDSGSPAFLFINGQAVLLTTWYGNALGPMLADFIPDINSALSSLGGGSAYTVTQADLSSFASY